MLAPFMSLLLPAHVLLDTCLHILIYSPSFHLYGFLITRNIDTSTIISLEFSNPDYLLWPFKFEIELVHFYVSKE